MCSLKFTLLGFFILTVCDCFGQTTEAWVRQVSGPAMQQVLVVEPDGQGNVYSSGTYYGPTILEGDSLPFDGNRTFLIKYDQFGSIIWRKIFKDVNCTDLKLTKSGDLLMAGSFSGTTVIGSTTLITNDDSDAFLTKFASNGNELWSRSAGGTWTDDFNAITVDKNNNILVIGTTWSSTFTYANSTCSTSPHQSIIHLMTDANGNLKWLKSYGGNSFDVSRKIAVDDAGNSYVSGDFASDTLYLGTDKLGAFSSWTYYLFKADSVGNVVWAMTTSPITDIQCDALGNVIISGRFVSKLDPNGNKIWGKTFSGFTTSIFINSQNQILVSGYSSADSVDYDGLPLSLGDAGGFIFQVSSTGQLIELRQFGNNKKDAILNMSGSNHDELYGGGIFHNTFILGNSVQTDNSYYSDGFTFRLADIKTSNNEELAGQHLLIYPNPSRDVIHVSGLTNDLRIELLDLLGSIYDINITNRNELVELDVSHLLPGIYILSASSPQQRQTTKLIIKE
jgi:hypothetical protein